jgi:protein-S-isoprenylcysteine O-methyltransferase Ste14
MYVFDIISNVVVIIGMLYLTFLMALAGWVAGLRRGEAVTLLPQRGNRPAGIWMQFAFVLVSLVIAAILFYILWIPVSISMSKVVSAALRVCGLVLFLLGMVLMVWARQTLGAMWGISTSRQVKLLANHHLIQSGPYASVRHPMYTGWWIALMGLVLLYSTWILIGLFVMSLLIFYRRARLEESVLAARFGVEWKAYMSRTKF